MKLTAMSDIHGRFEKFAPAELPEADLCIIAGDITTRGLRDTREFLASQRWIAGVVDRYPMTFWIPGNHDLLMPPDIYYPIGRGDHGLISLLDAPYVYRNRLFYGVALSTAYDMPELASIWEHTTTRREVEDAAFALVPPRTDILVSHSPPFGVLDAAGSTQNQDGTWEKRSIGSQALTNLIDGDNPPRVVICGHVHGAAGHVRRYTTDVYNVAEEVRIIEL